MSLYTRPGALTININDPKTKMEAHKNLPHFANLIIWTYDLLLAFRFCLLACHSKSRNVLKRKLPPVNRVLLFAIEFYYDHYGLPYYYYNVWEKLIVDIFSNGGFNFYYLLFFSLSLSLLILPLFFTYFVSKLTLRFVNTIINPFISLYTF